MRTLQDGEQGRRHPSGAAHTLLKIAAHHPELIREVAGMRKESSVESPVGRPALGELIGEKSRVPAIRKPAARIVAHPP